MNKVNSDILIMLSNAHFTNQREIAKKSGYSLGTVNKSIKNLIENDHINSELNLKPKAENFITHLSPKNAVILSAGYGIRMIPINCQVPKGLIKIYDEVLIERLILQLKSTGINEIYVVVGFMKEQYEYLIDKYGVKLIFNMDYSQKNNLHSLRLFSEHMGNSYIVPCDLWFEENPFNKKEIYSWYMLSEEISDGSKFYSNRYQEFRLCNKSAGNKTVGLCYINSDDAEKLANIVRKLDDNDAYSGCFWEEILMQHDNVNIYAKFLDKNSYFEINTYEDLKLADENSESLKSDIIDLLAEILHVKWTEIKNIQASKKGMTNRSFTLECNGKKYIMRIPGEGSDKLINRKQEADVYNVLGGKNISDNVIYLNPNNGYKLTEFIVNSKVCNPNDVDDLSVCMAKLREFHNMKLSVNHKFDLFGQINYYESLWNTKKSIYRDYIQTKKEVFSLKSYIESHTDRLSLSHIDAVPDNFLITENKSGKKEVKLIDWEYAGMQDPHLDIAMFCAYSLYETREDIDRLIDIYFMHKCPIETRVKIYCYVSAVGLLWSNWCEYKRSMGVEFAEYALKQYRFAKEYSRIAKRYIKDIERKKENA